MREIRTSGATRGEVALRVLPYSTVETQFSQATRFNQAVGPSLPFGPPN